MRILAIETSCDDTGIAILEGKGGFKKPLFDILANITHSQVAIHAEWFGVVPSLAKREHAKNLIPILTASLKKAGLLKLRKKPETAPLTKNITKILEKESEILADLNKFVETIETPKIDAIAVTYGPGLEPALWTGVNLAKVLSIIWNKPIVPVNHMEGHLFSSILDENKSKIKNPNDKKIIFPTVALLISGGHTELVLMKDWMKYKVLGKTRDDAAGEAFDKVARMIGLPYPGGPHISRLAEEFNPTNKIGLSFPRPMIASDNLDFSFSGLKTAVLYKVKELGTMSDDIKREVAHEFENAVTETLVAKTKKAVIKYSAKTLIVGGGVSANKKIRNSLLEMGEKNNVKVLLPDRNYSVDNAAMIAVAGYFRSLNKKNILQPKDAKRIKAKGNLSL